MFKCSTIGETFGKYVFEEYYTRQEARDEKFDIY